MSMDPVRGGRYLADLVGVLVGAIVVYGLGQLVLPSGDPCHGTSITVWSSTEPGLARPIPATGDDGRLGVLQQAARTYGCVDVVPISSGYAQQAIAGSLDRDDVTDLPDVWLPTDSFWNSLLDQGRGRYDDSLGSFTTSTMRLYVKVGSPLAAELGGAGSTTWHALAEQAAAGRLGLVKENALNSTSGAMATILAFEAAAGGGSGISADDVRAGKLDALAAPLERSVASYPGEIVDYLGSFRPPVDVAGLPNAMIVEKAVYEGFPDLGHYYRAVDLAGPDPTLDHPFLLRPGLDDRKHDLATAFFRTMTGDRWQDALGGAGFDAGTAGHPLTRRDGPVVRAVLDRWRETLRKRISLAITIDQSGSTDPYKRQVAEAMTTALRSLSATDRVAFFGFPGSAGAVYEPLTAGGFGDPTRLTVPEVVRRSGGSPVIEAVRETADLVRDEVGVNADNPRKQALIVITDGEQAGAGSTREQQRDTERIRRYRQSGVQVFFVLVGAKPLCVVDRIYSTLPSDCRATARPARLDQDEKRWVYCISDRPDCPTPLPSQRGRSSADHIRGIVKQIFDQLGGAPI
ncbi:vWA domain-containing protein [Actinoplanes sp. URMC 104]|uniref:vWA domain-containing protein n=1 Tax=Actinoplanes sp. URMC 104 TaxID=3423409 RepID=UPI003F19A406